MTLYSDNHFLKHFGPYILTKNVCLFISEVTATKENFVFRNSAVKAQHVLFENEPFLHKMLVSFSALVFLYTLEKLAWKNYVRFSKWNLKRTPQSTQNLFFEKIKFKVLHYIKHDYICQRPGLSKEQISMFKSLVNNYSILKCRHTF